MLRIQDQFDRISYGEIAPIPWFGSESIEQAIAFCRSFPSEFDADAIAQIPDSLPACQFGFESALELLREACPLNRSKLGNFEDGSAEKNLPICGLLPTGAGAIASLPSLLAQGYQTLKWKIAVGSIDQELNLLGQLLEKLPKTAKLRLDANGGLKFDAAQQWLEMCDCFSQIEFIEQPLPVDRLQQMLELSQQFATPIALDESVATIAQLQACYTQGWRGIFVVKAPIAGFPSRLLQFIQSQKLDVVWSSALETSIARRYIETHLIRSPDRALGMGISHLFEDEFDRLDAEQIWQKI